MFARTETRAFQEWVWPYASAMLFIKGRLKFFSEEGVEAGSAGSPSVLIAYGEKEREFLRTCAVEGAFVELNKEKEK